MRRVLLGLAGAALVLLAFVAGYATYPLLHQSSLAALPVAGEPSPAEADMSAYWQVWRLLDRDYFGSKPDTQQRIYGAIAGMVQTFGDPYTFFVEPQPRELERDQLAGKFGGIGASLEQTAEGWLLQPLPDQPAAQAGILGGDMLLMVDGIEITAQTASDRIIALVRGEPGTQVELVVRRAGNDGLAQQLAFRLTRAEIVTPSIEWRLLDDNPQTADVGYIRQTIFSERSAQEMREAVTALQAAGAHRYIWDLRGNPGGLLTIAVEMADMWLDEGVILIEEKADGLRKNYTATAGELVPNAGLVLIVDGASASASEIVAGALHDHGRAQLIGTRTYGKGSVQLIHELSDQSSLHVTNAQWLTPSGRQISGQGLLPDIVVAEDEDPLAAAIAALPSVQQAKK
ncbi:MAG: S41 family peptidase [Caldilineaceae bacterium]|nr:S41 family peptidase [Caldilineaceae bacterium]